MKPFDYFILTTMAVIIVVHSTVILEETVFLKSDDFNLEINLKTCAGLLRNGNLTHSTQQTVCADLIEEAFR
jgi:hypothetical protein